MTTNISASKSLLPPANPGQHAETSGDMAVSWSVVRVPSSYGAFQRPEYNAPTSDPELARLEEEERILDAAIAESEQIRELKLEKAALQARILDKKRQAGGGGSAT